jgi:tetratricopeptide (TPR) repeat protein
MTAIEGVMRVLLPSVVPFALLIGLSSAAAANSLGTAGPFRMVGTETCPAGFLAQLQGKCDPPPVDPKLAPQLRSAAEVQRALKLIALARMDQAKSALDAAIAADASNVTAYKLRARLAIPASLGSAEADVNAGLLLVPDDSDLLATRALLRKAIQDKAGAMRDANAAVAANPNNADAYWIRAQILRELQQFDAAEADLTKAVTIEPGDTRARMLRAQLRLSLNRSKDAADDASAVLQQNPADIFARQVRAVARGRLGDLAGAIDDLTVILGKPGQPMNVTPAQPAFSDLYVQRAILFARVGRPDNAMRDIDSVVAIGGRRAILRMQVYLRAHGFAGLRIDGKRSVAFDNALKACFIDNVCWPGLPQQI